MSAREAACQTSSNEIQKMPLIPHSLIRRSKASILSNSLCCGVVTVRLCTGYVSVGELYCFAGLSLLLSLWCLVSLVANERSSFFGISSYVSSLATYAILLFDYLSKEFGALAPLELFLPALSIILGLLSVLGRKAKTPKDNALL